MYIYTYTHTLKMLNAFTYMLMFIYMHYTNDFTLMTCSCTLK